MTVPSISRVTGLRQIRRAVLGLYALVALLCVVAVVGFLANQQATDSLCALRADLQTRVATSKQFLKEHPNGIPGIPAKTFRDGIKNQERTIRALSGLSCPNQ
jgi:hypothetical protein